MTIGGIFIGIALSILCGLIIILISAEFNLQGWTAGILIGLCVVGIFGGLRWYFTSTASGIRAVTDQKAELQNGLERTINIYTANGDLIATYTGKIDLEDNDGGYVLFEYEGKRYTYYNCFVESIADINQ